MKNLTPEIIDERQVRFVVKYVPADGEEIKFRIVSIEHNKAFVKIFFPPYDANDYFGLIIHQFTTSPFGLSWLGRLRWLIQVLPYGKTELGYIASKDVMDAGDQVRRVLRGEKSFSTMHDALEALVRL